MMMNWKTPGRAWLAALVACAALGSVAAAAADRRVPERVVVFGDSLSDPGNAFVLLQAAELPPFALVPDAPYARGGHHFTNGDTWVEQLAVRLKTPASAGPALASPPVFSNYAAGGARARPAGGFDLAVQTNLFFADTDGRAPVDALYVVFIGSNDVRDALDAFATDPTGVTSYGIVRDALGAVRLNLLALHTAGAHDFLVPNLPNLALVPAVRLQGPAAEGAARALATEFNAGLEDILVELETTLGVSIARLNVFNVLTEVVADPAGVGLTEVELPCIVPGTSIDPFCSNPEDYLFWDGIHPTRAGHRILALRAESALDETAVAGHAAE